MIILTIVGARPQFIKAAAISKEFSKQKKIKEEILHTGQHYEKNMSALFFEDLSIPKPFINLGIGGGTHGQNTGRMIEEIERVLLKKKPNGVLLYGDTDSTLAGALSASKLKIPIFHIEAGLRSFNRKQPEEQNRIVTDHLSDICFAPTIESISNLQKEGIHESRLVKTGDVMADSVRIFGGLRKNYIKFLKEYNTESKNFILTTFHRPENTDNYSKLKNILEALVIFKNKYSEINKNLKIIFPIHPRTKNKIKQFGLEEYLNNFEVLRPQGFIDMNILEREAKLIITDSGGIQKEAYLHKTPCVTIRNETEWVELIESKWNCLANTNDKKDILNAIDKQILFDPLSFHENFYGDGYAASTIVKKIIEFFN